MSDVVKRNRILLDQDVFSHNAWDDIEWSDDMIEEAERKILKQKDDSKSLGNSDDKNFIDTIEQRVSDSWNQFYTAHKDKFFKDRRWIKSEFPEIFDRLRILEGPQDTPCSIFEVGCGVGNAITQFLELNSNPNLKIYACDISSNAIDTLKSRDLFNNPAFHIEAFQADICNNFETKISTIIPKESLDFITLIFCLSALKPECMKQAVKNLSSLLKTNGIMFFRDYGQYDLTQLRFKGKSFLRDNYYVRFDGTTSYFFTKPEVDELFGINNAGLRKLELNDDRRLLVNRAKGLKMPRCWIQAKYVKI